MSIAETAVAAAVTAGINLVVQDGLGPILRGTVESQSVGTLKFGRNKAEILLNLQTGRPSYHRECEEEVFDAGNFRWHVYMQISGTWKKRITANGGVILHVNGSVHGPLCPLCMKTGPFTQISGIWGRKWQCGACGKRFAYRELDSINRHVTKKLARLITRSLGV